MKAINSLITQTCTLLELYAAFIRSSEYNGVWVVEVPRTGASPKIIAGIANGEFAVASS